MDTCADEPAAMRLIGQVCGAWRSLAVPHGLAARVGARVRPSSTTTALRNQPMGGQAALREDQALVLSGHAPARHGHEGSPRREGGCGCPQQPCRALLGQRRGGSRESSVPHARGEGLSEREAPTATVPCARGIGVFHARRLLGWVRGAPADRQPIRHLRPRRQALA